ncbi:general secretion pathway protein G [Magnetococcus marinus MC-1]|uniref:General secretion pathway protein G n=1 Tax=Magnetococcus marinus (strain ATCC BAA-1437 / JCM 17883 / MC-1) TaxID=156889 RepID=A0LDH3_MAGMM|nr:type II secretion system major pseudopilin GspG [Magnetococcus marinus]ABK46016.1 general secretion pathway protein G [Magnetococcus marinus MC-1]
MKPPLPHTKRWRIIMVELLVVLSLGGFIWFFFGGQLIEQLRGGQTEVAQNRMKILEEALLQYGRDVGDYPSQNEGLDALIESPRGAPQWQGPYTSPPALLDPWNRSFYYVYPGHHGVFDLYSLGRDNKKGGVLVNRDVQNWP